MTDEEVKTWLSGSDDRCDGSERDMWDHAKDAETGLDYYADTRLGSMALDALRTLAKTREALASAMWYGWYEFGGKTISCCIDCGVDRDNTHGTDCIFATMPKP